MEEYRCIEGIPKSNLVILTCLCLFTQLDKHVSGGTADCGL